MGLRHYTKKAKSIDDIESEGITQGLMRSLGYVSKEEALRNLDSLKRQYEVFTTTLLENFEVYSRMCNIIQTLSVAYPELMKGRDT